MKLYNVTTIDYIDGVYGKINSFKSKVFKTELEAKAYCSSVLEQWKADNGKHEYEIGPQSCRYVSTSTAYHTTYNLEWNISEQNIDD